MGPAPPGPDERGEAAFATVLLAAQAGAPWAIERLYARLQPGLLRYLGARAPGLAEDIGSQVWLEMAQGLPRFEGGEDAFRALLFTIARRRLSNERRRLGRRREDPSADVPEPRRAPAATDGPGAGLEAGLDGDAAAALVVRLLPPLQADVVLLRVLADLDVDQVAAVLGRRPGTVRVQHHRALKRLAAHLGDRAGAREALSQEAARSPGSSSAPGVTEARSSGT